MLAFPAELVNVAVWQRLALTGNAVGARLRDEKNAIFPFPPGGVLARKENAESGRPISCLGSISRWRNVRYKRRRACFPRAL
jgi:hypothetical protein